MIRYVTPALTAICLMCATATQTHAQIALRAGGGLYVEEKEPGWHASIILPFGSKPAGVMLAGEYYEKSGAITVPVSIRGLYKFSLGGNLRIYGGAGSGFIYTKEESDAELIDGSASRVLLTAVAGMNLKMLGPIRFFMEATLDRGVAEGTENKYAAKAGISLTFKD
ncbi:MAG: hypothetical protein OXU79_15485 [Gemmatimonadota bacterium]|nr:hypothetical protein [Gemmatimonadota bacterium]